VLLYEGKFSTRLQWLRRVSLGSTVVSVVGFPLAFQLGAGGGLAMPLVGQLMIAGTAIFTSLSSTIFLQTLTSPYVAKLYSLDQQRQQLLAHRVNLFGNLEPFTFSLSQVEKVTASVHPFASFRAGNRFFYIHTAAMGDDANDVRKKLEA